MPTLHLMLLLPLDTGDRSEQKCNREEHKQPCAFPYPKNRIKSNAYLI